MTRKVTYIRGFERCSASISDCLAKASLKDRCQVAHTHTRYFKLLDLRSGKELEGTDGLVDNVFHDTVTLVFYIPETW